mgnify:CR=1 FL=1
MDAISKGPPTKVGKEGVVLLSHWAIQLPFEASEKNPKTVGRVVDDAWPWVKKGMRLYAVNGIRVPSVPALPAVLRMTSEPGEDTHLDVKIGVGKDGDFYLIEEQLILFITQYTVLKNGMRFRSRHEDGARESILIRVPMELIKDFCPGDRRIRYVPTGEVFDGRTSMRDVFQRERRPDRAAFLGELERAGRLYQSTIQVFEGAAEANPQPLIVFCRPNGLSGFPLRRPRTIRPWWA